MKTSICTSHLAPVVIANFIIAAMTGMFMHYAWMRHSEIAMGAAALLLAAACVLSLYLWVIVLCHVMNPLQSLIDTLLKAVDKLPVSGSDVPQNPTPRQIARVTIIMRILQETALRIEQAAKELKEKKEHLQTILETIPDAIITIDTNGLIQMINSTTEKTFGFARPELVGQKIDMLLTAAGNENYKHDIERCLQEDCDPILRETSEMEAKRKDGSAFPIEIWISSLRYNGHPVCLHVIRDVSRRKRNEAANAHYLHELESSNRELDDFAYIVSHDLKEPLRGLQTFSNFLLEDYESKLDEEGKHKLRTIGDLTKNMANLLDTLLYYSRVGKTALAIHETDLDEVVHKVADSFSINLKEKNVTIDIPQKLPLTVCDHVRIAEVFQNLIGNAIKYNDNNENKIEIGVVKDHPRKPGEIVFYVRDQGIGIEEKYLDTIFKIFKRLHARGAYGGGTGSGLAIVKKIISQHGGEIWAESKGPGQGTTFFFTIPQQKKE